MSNVYLSTTTEIINSALRKLGVIIQGDTAADSQLTEALQALNVMTGRFFTLGMPFYKETKFTVTPLVSGQATYSLTSVSTDGGLFNVYQSFLYDTTTKIEIPLRVISREEYNAMTNKSVLGTPVMVCISPDGLTCTTYLTPDATTAAQKQLILYGYRNETVYTSGTDNLAFPREWTEALIYGLAVRLAPEYGTALEVTQALNQIADSALRDAVNWNPESNSTYFGVSNYGRK